MLSWSNNLILAMSIFFINSNIFRQMTKNRIEAIQQDKG